MMYGGCAQPSEVDSAEVRKKGREEDRAVEGVERGTRNERRWSVVTANYTIVGRLTMEQLRAASEQTE